MKKRNLVTVVFLLILSAVLLYENRHFSIGTLSSPGPGFFPLILAIVLSALTLVLLGQTLRLKQVTAGTLWVSPGKRKILAGAIAILLGFACLLEFLGYLLCTFLFVALLLRAIGSKRPGFILLFASLCTAISYSIFGILLKAQLPLGLAGIWTGK